MAKKNRTFHNILNQNNEISAYLLGFWMADGSISLSSSKNRIRKQKRFVITNTDRQLMTKFGVLFGKSPRACPNFSGGVKVKNIYKLSMKSDQLFDFCYLITRSTTKSDKEVQIPEIPDHLFHHFIRGFFDGDGSISIRLCKTRHGKICPALQTTFTAGLSTGLFLERLRDRIRKFISVGLKKVNTGKTSRKLVFNQYDSMLLCEWMYQDATWYMERKKVIWDSTDKEKLKNSRKFFSKEMQRSHR